MIVNQWIPAAHRGDAVGDYARSLAAIFRTWGHTAQVYAQFVDDDLREEVRSWPEAGADDGDVTFYHFAVPSPMTARFATLPGRRILLYHNITPARFFAPYAPALARMAAAGREELASLSGRTDLALGVSDYNRAELDALGFADTGVLPLLVDTARLTSAPSVPALSTLLDDGLANILFVGRIAPNKCIEDHIRFAEVYKRYIDAHYRFIFVGRTGGVPRYYAAIRALVNEFRMLPERFWFTGPVPEAELATYYRHAHLYVSLSEHEGFCAPIVEAMAMDVPVLAYGAAAVPETLGGAGVTFAPKDLEQAAELAADLIYDESLRAPVLAGQRARLADFSQARLEPLLKDIVGS